MTELQIIEVKDIREKCIENIEVLTKVGELFLIPKMEAMTTKMVADYYKVDFGVIQTCYQRNKEEIQQDGVVKRKLGDFIDSKEKLDSLIKSRTSISFKIDGVYKVTIPNCGTLCFSQRAILRIGMLLRDSIVAKEIRTQLLNVFEKTKPEQKIQSINEEIILQAKVGKAYMGGNIEEFAKASMEYNAFQNRYKEEMENKVVTLTITNKELETTNALLTRKSMEWGYKSILNALIRKYATQCFNGNYKFSDAWKALYRQVKHKLHIDIENRQTAKKPIDRITDDEMPQVVMVAVGLCEANNINVGKVVNSINSENIRQLA